jgi:hypothetical protein
VDWKRGREVYRIPARRNWGVKTVMSGVHEEDRGNENKNENENQDADENDNDDNNDDDDEKVQAPAESCERGRARGMLTYCEYW